MKAANLEGRQNIPWWPSLLMSRPAQAACGPESERTICEVLAQSKHKKTQGLAFLDE